jgi:hypothetical protein
MAVVTDRHADPPGLRVVDGRRCHLACSTARGSRILGDVNHARAAEQPAVRVDDRRATYARAVPLVEIEDDTIP